MASRLPGHKGLFGINFDGSSFGSLARDTTGDFVLSPGIDLTNIAATLAAGPRIQCSAGAASPALPRKCSVSPRKMRPHRGEHVKRIRMTYDAFGGQDPKIPLSAVSFSATSAQQQPLATASEATEAGYGQNDTPGHGLFSRLCESMGMLVREMLFGNGSHV